MNLLGSSGGEKNYFHDIKFMLGLWASLPTWLPTTRTCLFTLLANAGFFFFFCMFLASSAVQKCHAQITYNQQALLYMSTQSHFEFNGFIPPEQQLIFRPQKPPPPPPGRP